MCLAFLCSYIDKYNPNIKTNRLESNINTKHAFIHIVAREAWI
jgi:hypothetical protein